MSMPVIIIIIKYINKKLKLIKKRHMRADRDCKWSSFLSLMSLAP